MKQLHSLKRSRINSSSCTTSLNGRKNASIQTSLGRWPNLTNFIENVEVYEFNEDLKQLLECPLCVNIALMPIKQCRNGHIICNNCRLKVR